MTSMNVLRPEIPEKFARYRKFLEENTRRTTILKLRPVIVHGDKFPGYLSKSPAGSRIGGPALVTDNFPWPVDSQGKPMMHMAQLNMAELPTREGYPTEGLLQFFHGNDDCYGITSTPNHVVRYIPAAELAHGRLHGTIADQTDAIWDGYFEVTGQLFDQFPTGCDIETENLELPDGLNDPDNDDDSERYEIFELNPSNTIFGGGWAYFTQEDPRLYEKGLDDYRLLLQLDTETPEDGPVSMMFGDAGVANFFIHPADLAALNFDNVFYTWDCC